MRIPWDQWQAREETDVLRVKIPGRHWTEENKTAFRRLKNSLEGNWTHKLFTRTRYIVPATYCFKRETIVTYIAISFELETDLTLAMLILPNILESIPAAKKR